MKELIKIQIRHEGQVVDGFLLGTYEREYYQFQQTLLERLFCRKTKSKIQTVIRKTYLVFLPWKHRIKQVAEVTNPDVVPFEEVFPREWISIPEFVSVGTEEYHTAVSVRCFFGYPFIWQNKSFIADQISGEYETNLKILYSEIPELLNEEYDEDAFK